MEESKSPSSYIEYANSQTVIAMARCEQANQGVILKVPGAPSPQQAFMESLLNLLVTQNKLLAAIADGCGLPIEKAQEIDSAQKRGSDGGLEIVK